MTMSTDSNSANVTLETVRRIKAQGGRTVLGVSNISFGLPQREIITSAFFTMAMQAGLSAGIVNPNSQAMMQAYDTFRVLGGYDAQCMSYVEKYSAMKVVSTTVKAGAETDKSKNQATGSTSGGMDLKTCIIKGLKEPAYKVTKKMLEEKEPLEIINTELVPALDIVGKGFEKGTMFLPQLLMSAEAAKAGFAAVKEFMEAKGSDQQKKALL